MLVSLRRPARASREYEFGNKVELICTAKRQVVFAIKAFEGNPHDSRTISPLLEQMETGGMKMWKRLVYCHGGRGAKEVRSEKVIMSGKLQKRDSEYER